MQDDSVHADRDLLLEIVVQETEDLMLFYLDLLFGFPLMLEILRYLGSQYEWKLLVLHVLIHVEHVLPKLFSKHIMLPDDLFNILNR